MLRQGLRLFFRLLYNEFAWTYDWVAWAVSFGHWKAWGRTALSYLTSERVLEIAHGPGHLLVALQEGGWKPVGVDLSRSMSRIARRRLRKEGLDTCLARARAQELPFPDDHFESVVSTFPAEFILDRRTLQEVVRVLAPGGRMVIVASVRIGGQGIVGQFLRWLYRFTGQSEPVPDVGERALADIGLEAEAVWEDVGHDSVMLVVAEAIH